MVAEVLVLGCGVIGLTASITLAQKGYKVTIWAKDLPPNTTSNKAAAIWQPFLAYPKDKVAKWSGETLQHYMKEAIKEPSSGVLVRKSVELFKVRQEEEPFWKDTVKIRRAHKEELLGEYTDGFTTEESVVADTDVYMNFLLNKAKQVGVQIVVKEVKQIDEAFERFNFVINCTGLGSRQLFNDTTIFPTRGQVLLVKNTAVLSAIMDDDHDTLAYIIPRSQTTVLGGTAQEHDWNTEPSQKDTDAILSKIKKLSPGTFDNSEVVAVKVGLRPTRPEIRLEPEWHKDGKKLIIHNYGHGGSGFTVCWGCAKEVLEILEKHAARSKL